MSYSFLQLLFKMFIESILKDYKIAIFVKQVLSESISYLVLVK